MTNCPRFSLSAAWRRALAPTLLVMLGACSPDTENIEVSVSIKDAALTIAPSTFGTADDPQGTLSGTFTLVLELGPLADKAANVEPQQFVIQIGDSTSVVPPVPVAANAPKSIPVNPGQGQKVIYEFTYDGTQKIKDLCQNSKQARINAVVTDTSGAGTKNASSEVFVITGCP